MQNSANLGKQGREGENGVERDGKIDRCFKKHYEIDVHAGNVKQTKLWTEFHRIIVVKE